MRTKVNGITFQSGKQREVFANLRPTGTVTLVPDDDNKYDPYAVQVWYGEVLVGHLPARYKAKKPVGSPEQMAVRELGVKTATIQDYSYYDEATDSFNDDHVGVLQSMTLEMNADGASTDGTSKSFGSVYMRVTKFIGFFNFFGSTDGLILWNLKQLIDNYTWEEASEEVLPFIEESKTTPWLDKSAKDGIVMHDSIYDLLSVGQDIEGGLPSGWDKFREMFNPEMCYGEERFFDDTLCVSGQPDFVGYVTIPTGEDKGKRVLAVVDWKSSKSPSHKHLLQASIYAKNAQWEGKDPTHAVVVCFNDEASKRGFKYRIIDRKAIEHNYSAARKLRELIDMIGVVPDSQTFTKKELMEV